MAAGSCPGGMPAKALSTRSEAVRSAWMSSYIFRRTDVSNSLPRASASSPWSESRTNLRARSKSLWSRRCRPSTRIMNGSAFRTACRLSGRKRLMRSSLARAATGSTHSLARSAKNGISCPLVCSANTSSAAARTKPFECEPSTPTTAPSNSAACADAKRYRAQAGATRQTSRRHTRTRRMTSSETGGDTRQLDHAAQPSSIPVRGRVIYAPRYALRLRRTTPVGV
jgi:hypothetical protein